MNTKTALSVGTLGLSTITVAVMLTMHFNEEPVPFESLHFSAPELTASLDQDEILGAENIRYTSSSLSYEVLFPGTWEMDDSDDTDVLSSDDGNTVIRIDADALPEGSTAENVDALAAQVEEKYRNEEGLEITKMDRGNFKNYPAVLIEGVRGTDSGEWNVKTYVVFRSTDAFIVTVNNQSEDTETIQKVIDSLNIEGK